MTTAGIAGLFIHTTNWGATVAFWQRLGYVVEFDTGHGSGRLRHPDGGPYLFVAEDPTRASEGFLPVLEVADADESTTSAAVPGVQFEPTHWGTRMATVQDPDHRPVAIEQISTDPGQEQ